MKEIKKGDMCVVCGKENIKRRVLDVDKNAILLWGYYEYIPVTEVTKVEE